jgi:hypothetical protein
MAYGHQGSGFKIEVNYFRLAPPILNEQQPEPARAEFPPDTAAAAETYSTDAAAQ